MASEADTRANFIDPALLAAGWGKHQIIREYYFTDGRKLAGNQRGSRCFVDYLLHTENQHLAIIEAKKISYLTALKTSLLDAAFMGQLYRCLYSEKMFLMNEDDLLG